MDFSIKRPGIPEKILYATAAFCMLALMTGNIYYLFRRDIAELFSSRSLKFGLICLSLIPVLTSLLALACVKLAKATGVSRLPSLFFAAITGFLTFSAKYAFVLIVKTQQYSDYQLFHWVTHEIATKNPKYLGETYFSVFAYQTGFPAFMSPLYKLFPSVDAMITVNCIFIALSAALAYLIAECLTDRVRAFFLTMLISLIPFPYALAGVYTNQHLALLFWLAACYALFCLETRRIYFTIALAAVALAFCNAVRPEGILTLLAVCAALVLSAAKKPELNAPGRFDYLRRLALFAACYFITVFAISAFFVLSGLNPQGLKNNFPLYRLAVGLNEDSKGKYSMKLDDLFFKDTDEQKRNEDAVRVIKENLNNPGLVPLLFDKAKIMWMNEDRDYPALTQKDDSEILSVLGFGISVHTLRALMAVGDSVFYAVVFGMCGLAFLYAFKHGGSATILFFALFIMAALAAFTIAEVQRRYSYVALYPLLLSALHAKWPFKSKTTSL